MVENLYTPGEFDYIFSEPNINKFAALVRCLPESKRVDYYREFGRYLGYPECCIADFIDRYINHKDTTVVQNKISRQTGYTGFVPCNDCCNKIIGGATIHSLIVNRRHFEPFPKLHSL